MAEDTRCRVLVANDDGFANPGIVLSATAVAEAGHDVVLACPDGDYSGSGASLGRMHSDEHIDVQQVALTDGDLIANAVDGPPAMRVIAAALGGFGPSPDLIVSGINPGLNTGLATLHSGTVGAALTAATFGSSGLAVSIDAGDPQHWDTAARLAVEALKWLVAQRPRTVVNLNVPNVSFAEVRGTRVAGLAPFGVVRAAIVENEGGRLQMELRETTDILPSDSDIALVAEGYAAISTIRGVRVDDQRALRQWVGDGPGLEDRAS